MNSKDIAGMTGAGNYGKRFAVSEITFNGDSGEFFYRHKDAEKGEDGKYPKENLGKELSVVFMKIRRKLSVFKKGGNGLSTNEHNTKADTVVVYGPNNMRDVGNAAAMREKYQELRTQQMVYSYFPSKKEVVRLVIKGASLGSESTAKGVVKFYDYLQSFGNDEHMHEFFTKLTPVGEKGPKGTYYAMNFERGAKLTEEQQEKVNERIVEVHTALTEGDEAFKQRMNMKDHPIEKDEEDEDEGMPTIQADEDPLASEFENEDKVQYPDDEINPEDIPF